MGKSRTDVPKNLLGLFSDQMQHVFIVLTAN